MKKMLVFFILLLQGQVVSFGQCDSSLEPSTNPTVAYKVRGNRCEGAYSAKVGAPSMEIAGFTIGPLSYDLTKTEIIKIENPMKFPISIRSSALSIGTYYRMDALIGTNDILNWAVRDVLFELGIPAKYLGVYGWFGTDHQKTYLPVKAVSNNFNETNRTLYLTIRPGTKAIQAKYRYALKDQELGKYYDARLLNSRKSIRIVLPANLKGEYNIEIAALLESGKDWAVEQYKFMKP